VENVEGNTFSSELFINGEARMLQVYSAHDFELGAPQLRIDGISFRLDETVGTTIGGWNIAVFISTTPRAPDAFTPDYNSNHGSDGVLVLSGGAAGIVSMETGPGPRTFLLDIAFSTPFLYDPAKGNLAVDIVAAGTRILSLDAQSMPGDSVGRVFGPNALSGTVDTLGLVARFEVTPIPEPSVVTLFALCTVVVAILAAKKSRVAEERENE
jgi:hypothetical protein